MKKDEALEIWKTSELLFLQDESNKVILISD